MQPGPGGTAGGRPAAPARPTSPAGRRRATRVASAAGAVALLVGASACTAPSDGGSGDAAEAADAATSVVIGTAAEPETLNPLLGFGKDGSAKIFEGLLTTDQDLTLVPALARELPEISSDGLTYTFTLRDGVTFSDGEPLTAADVAFTYRAILDERVANASRSELDAVRAVETPDDSTVVFHLKYPYAPFAARTVLPIVPEHAFGGTADGQLDDAEAAAVASGSFDSAPVGTGPYLLESWRKGDQLTLTANPDYWGDGPAVTHVTLAFIPDDNTRATRLAAGELDAAVLPPQLAATFDEGQPQGEGKRVIAAESADYRGVMLPMDNPVTGDVDIRRALDRGIDRQAMVADVLDGRGEAGLSAIAPASQYYEPAAETAVDRGPEAAAALLDEAGWRLGADGIRAKDGQRAAFTLLYPSGDTLRQDLALAYAADARELGVEVTVEGLTWEAIDGRINRDAVLMGGGSALDPDFVTYPALHSSHAGDGYNNPGMYRNDEVDRLLDEARRSTDPAVRAEAYSALQQELVREPYWNVLVFLDHVYVVADRWDNVTTQLESHDHGLLNGPWWNIEDWTPAAS
ncbi:ABC transporter substrate-binding protein [Allostreptomyces psammosilenae]|nr:ABC transporter substrate-binding protein [Allostreptomyces psammosilenae]